MSEQLTLFDVFRGRRRLKSARRRDGTPGDRGPASHPAFPLPYFLDEADFSQLSAAGRDGIDWPATIALSRTAGGTLGSVDQSTYLTNADTGTNFRVDVCQYVYNVAASWLGVGTYRVDISINGVMVGHAVFALK